MQARNARELFVNVGRGPRLRPEDVLPTGDPLIDNKLGGGLPSGLVIQMAGLPGVGKTQLCLQLTAQKLRELSETRSLRKILYINTGAPFPIERLLQISDCAPDSDLLERLLVRHVKERDGFLEQVPQWTRAMGKQLCMIVVDSVAGLFRIPDDNSRPDWSYYIRRGKKFTELVSYLKAFAQHTHSLLLIVNEASGGASRSLDTSGPALGRLWDSFIDIRIWMDKAATNDAQGLVHARHSFRMESHPKMAPFQCDYYLTKSGLATCLTRERSDF